MPRPAPDSGAMRDAARAEWKARWLARHVGAEHWPDAPPEWRAPKAVTLWLPVILSFLVQVPSAVWLARTSDARAPVDLLAITIALVGPLALIAARRFPGPVVAVVSAAAAADLFVTDLMTGDRGGPPYLALAFALVSAIVRGARIWAFISVAVCWAGTLILAGILQLEWQGWRIAATTLGILIVLAIGESMRTRRERYQAIRSRYLARRQNEVQAERVRIARELHDVLAHSLSQINVQAGVGLHLMDKQPAKAAEALASIKETSKTALDEVRTVLGVLRAEHGADPSAPLVPEPDLSRLSGLAASVSSQGLAVELDDRLGEDAAELPKPVQLAVYRIVQESLTNAVRHAAATSVVVTLRRDAAELVIAVQDDGAGGAAASRPVESGGRGLLGMRERAELLGGTLVAGPAAPRGFRVEARLPLRDERTGDTP